MIWPPASDLIPKAQNECPERETGETPTEPILPPQPSGIYEVDDRVIACESEMGFLGDKGLTKGSLPCSKYQSPAWAKLWCIIVG